MISIRPAVAADQSILEDMLFLAIWTAPGTPRPPRSLLAAPELRQYVAGWGHHPGDIGVVAESDAAQPLGAAWLRLLPPPGGYGFVAANTPELSIALVPAARRQGLGHQLLAALMAMAQPLYAAVSLSVAPDSPAVGFYRRAGFVDVEQRPDSLVMVRNCK